VPIFIREIAPPSISGKMVGAYSIGGGLGAILVYGLAFLLPITPTDDDQLWKYMYAIPAVVAALQLVIFLTALRFDSPKYYLIKNKEKEAKDVIVAIYKEEFVEEAFEREHKAERSHKLLDVISKYRYPLMLCMFLYFTVQYMGTGMLGYYSTYIFLGTESGDVQNTPAFLLEIRVLNMILALIGFSTSIIGSSLIDRFGRRIILLLGSVGITVLLFAFAGFGMNGDGFLQRLSFVTLCIISGLAYGMVVAVYIAEVVPPKGNSILNTWDNFNQQIITFLFPVVVNTPAKMNTAFIGFGLVGMLSLPVLWFFVKETKNKSLHEIYMMFKFHPKDEPILKIYDEEEPQTPAYMTDELLSA
jgi:MFS family permease